MRVNSIKTEKVSPGDDLYKILDDHLKDFPEGSILAITSKIVALCQNRVGKVEDKDQLIEREADLYYPAKLSRYQIYLTIKDSQLVANSGIDQSNGNDQLILWPENSPKVANEVRSYLKKRFNLERVGVIITDSATSPLQWGTTGVALGYSGFKPLREYIGQKDIYGREMAMTKANIANDLATAAVLVMGEGSEQTPLAVLEDLDFVEFVVEDPSQEELDSLKIELEDDLYSPLLTSVEWKKGGS
jgi:dihydrofolate synthase / folylpolyglutamate synthase